MYFVVYGHRHSPFHSTPNWFFFFLFMLDSIEPSSCPLKNGIPLEKWRKMIKDGHFLCRVLSRWAGSERLQNLPNRHPVHQTPRYHPRHRFYLPWRLQAHLLPWPLLQPHRQRVSALRLRRLPAAPGPVLLPPLSAPLHHAHTERHLARRLHPGLRRRWGSLPGRPKVPALPRRLVPPARPGPRVFPMSARLFHPPERVRVAGRLFRPGLCGRLLFRRGLQRLYHLSVRLLPATSSTTQLHPVSRGHDHSSVRTPAFTLS